MTGPVPGSDDDDAPRPWNGRPHESPYYVSYDQQEPEEPPWSDPAPLPAAGPNRRIVAAIVVATVVVVVGGVAVWWFAVGPGRGDQPRPVAVTRSSPPPMRHAPPPSSTSPDNAAAYDVGSCFDEAQGAAPGKVELNLVACGSDRAVFVINQVVDAAAGCDAAADYKDHGYEVPDETANVAYCASLVVPANVCFTLAATQPIQRTACGSTPGTVQVLAIEAAPSATTACTDKTNPDVWFYQSPTSGQFACVSRPATTSTSPATATS
jgi:hypothetical protein